MKYFWTVLNVFVIGVVVLAVLQLVPSLVSSTNTVEFLTGIGLCLLGVAFIVARFIEIYNEKVEK